MIKRILYTECVNMEYAYEKLKNQFVMEEIIIKITTVNRRVLYS